MPNNMSKNDRLFRFAMFMFAVTLAIAWQSWVLLALAAIPLITGMVGFCPIYAITHYTTVKDTD